MPRRACIFCGTRPTTREHIVSRWAYDVLVQDPRVVAPEGEHIRFNDAGIQPVWTSAKPVDFVANCVCDRCNGRWMNDVEGAAQPAISAMIKGEPLTLDRRVQDAVAGWLGLKAIVERYSHSPIHPVRTEWIDYYYQHRCPPDTWQIRISRYVGDRPVRLAGGEITATFRHNLAPVPIHRSGMLFSIAIGYFFGQVLGVDRRTVVPQDRRVFAQIWPHPLLRLEAPDGMHNDLVTWPPEGWLNDADLERYSRDVTGSAR